MFLVSPVINIAIFSSVTKCSGLAKGKSFSSFSHSPNPLKISKTILKWKLLQTKHFEAAADLQNVRTIGTSGRIYFSGLGLTFKLNKWCFVVNTICGPYLAVLLYKSSGKYRTVTKKRWLMDKEGR